MLADSAAMTKHGPPGTVLNSRFRGNDTGETNTRFAPTGLCCYGVLLRRTGSLRVSLNSFVQSPKSGGQRGLTARLEQRASQATSLDSRFRENGTMKRCKDTSRRESEDAPHLHPLPSRERGLLASQGCAEGQSPFAGSLRVSLNSFVPSPKSGGQRGLTMPQGTTV